MKGDVMEPELINMPNNGREGTLPHRRVAERPRLQVLRLHETRPRRNSPHQEIGVSPHPVERAASPLLQHTGGPRSCAAVWRAAILAATRLPLPMVGRGVPPSRLMIGNNCLKTTRLWRAG